jgi:hypothetical protein
MSSERVRPVDTVDGVLTPRRQVLRTMSAAGAAVLGVFGLSDAALARKAQGEKNTKKKKAGRAGPPGPVGPAGPPGPAGPAAAASIVLGPEVLWNVPAGSLESGIAPCPDSDTPLGPSFYLGNSDCHVSVSRPASVNSWQLEVRYPATQSSPDNSLRAVCLHVVGSS